MNTSVHKIKIKYTLLRAAHVCKRESDSIESYRTMERLSSFTYSMFDFAWNKHVGLKVWVYFSGFHQNSTSKVKSWTWLVHNLYVLAHLRLWKTEVRKCMHSSFTTKELVRISVIVLKIGFSIKHIKIIYFETIHLLLLQQCNYQDWSIKYLEK